MGWLGYEGNSKNRSDLPISGTTSEVGGWDGLAMRVTVKTGLTYL